jgi:hypothetical protein
VRTKEVFDARAAVLEATAGKWYHQKRSYKSAFVVSNPLSQNDRGIALPDRRKTSTPQQALSWIIAVQSAREMMVNK